MKFGKDIHDAQMIIPTDFGDPNSRSSANMQSTSSSAR